jgi:tetratricopeptide (TPR) repeat protein
MVKFRGKTKNNLAPHIDGEIGVPQVYAGGSDGRHNSLLEFRPTRQTLLLLVVAVLVVGSGSWWILTHEQNGTEYGVKLPDTKKYYSNRITMLESQAPPQGASDLEKAKYYDKLAGAFVEINDYEHAVEYMEKIESISPTYFDYHGYILLASYYHELNEKSKAGAALDKAITLLPNTDIPSELPRKDLLKRIDDFRKEYAS